MTISKSLFLNRDFLTFQTKAKEANRYSLRSFSPPDCFVSNKIVVARETLETLETDETRETFETDETLETLETLYVILKRVDRSMW